MSYRGSRRVRTLLTIGAHVVVLGILFQIAAFDHWNLGFQSVQGVQGSSTHIHASHCHGDVAGCADAGGAAANVLNAHNQYAIPRSHTFSAGVTMNDEQPEEIFVETPARPPQAA